MKKIAIIWDSPYNTIYKRLEVINAGDNFTTNPVRIVSVDYYNSDGDYPYCIYKDERYDYKNGQYYHSRYTDKEEKVITYGTPFTSDDVKSGKVSFS